MSKPKRQHWVPRFYLRYFATPETKETSEPRAWIFSKDEGAPALTSIRKVAAQHYLYSPKDRDGNRQWSADQKLTELEGTLASVWPLLTNEFLDLHGDGALRKAIALFISVLHLRHPRRLSEIERLHAQMLQTYETFPKDENGCPRIDAVEVNGVLRPLDNSDWAQYRAAGVDEKKQMFIGSLLQNATHYAEILMKKRWSVVFSEAPAFITTDTPVAVIHQTRDVFGFTTPGTVISFPLSPTRVLMMDDRHDQPKGHYYPLADTGPGPANFVAWRNCERFMISSRPTDPVFAEMLA